VCFSKNNSYTAADTLSQNLLICPKCLTCVEKFSHDQEAISVDPTTCPFCNTELVQLEKEKLEEVIVKAKQFLNNKGSSLWDKIRLKAINFIAESKM